MEQSEKKMTKAKLFGRIQLECLRRSVTPFVLYMMMSLLLLACQAIEGAVLRYILSAICLLGAMAYNGHLCYLYGKTHYDAYLTGNIHRQNALFGIQSGGDHRPEREYRVWKGFNIGFYVGVVAVIFGLLWGLFPEATPTIGTLFIMIAGWAIIPIQWFNNAGVVISPFVSMAMAIFPILVSGIMYIVGAKVEEKRKLEETERMERVENARKGGKKESKKK